MSVAKPFAISKRVVKEAYRRVKSRGGGPGVDGETIEAFESDLKNNLYRIWNRLSSGSYFPPPVLQEVIPKPGGSGERELGIPTVSDRVAQMTVKMYLEPKVEPKFHWDSYAYRPKRSAVQAVAKARERCWRYAWVLDLDIRRFFDTLDHELVLRAVGKYTQSRWVLLYIGRWLRAPLQRKDGTLEVRESGSPQGGVISPLLANVFMHLAFDTWMYKEYREVPFERYADDIVVHCWSQAEAERLLDAVRERLERCRLSLNEAKTKIVYCRDSNRRGPYSRVSFDFLGYTFRPRRARNGRGEVFVSFLPAVSRRVLKRMRRDLRWKWRVRLRSDKSLNELAGLLNPTLRGWVRYYGVFYKTAMNSLYRSLDLALAKWAMRKFKKLRRRKRRAREWLARVAQRQPDLFVHWNLSTSQRTLVAGR